MADTLTHEAFSKHLGSKFEVELGPDRSTALQLTEVSELKKSHRQEEFSIVLRGPNDVFLGQGTHQMNHEKLGKFEIFIVPISQDEKGYRYEAVFNRLRSEAENVE